MVDAVVGPARLARFDLVLAGDDVPKKKPDPLIYNLASQRLGVPHDRCLVVEDSLVGLRAAQVRTGGGGGGGGVWCIYMFIAVYSRYACAIGGQ